MNNSQNIFNLVKFHNIAGRIDYRQPMELLLCEFNKGNIADRDRTVEESVIQAYLGECFGKWDEVLPEFPDCPGKRRSITREYHRGKRDAYLQDLIVDKVARGYEDGEGGRDQLIVNPATVFGRHGRALACRLPEYQIVATDIDSRWDFWYRLFVSWWEYGTRLRNFKFVTESVFAGDLTRKPVVVTFFGACGSVTDGCMDYAISAGSPFLICRSCCHDNIGGNTEIVRRATLINRLFVWKNREFARIKKKGNGYYFSDHYNIRDAYPRSTAGRELMDSDTIIAIAQNSVDSDVCRSLIDLDRCLYLIEHGYDVLYREELFFAHKR